MPRGLNIEHLLLYLFVMAFKTRPNFFQHTSDNISYIYILKENFTWILYSHYFYPSFPPDPPMLSLKQTASSSVVVHSHTYT